MASALALVKKGGLSFQTFGRMGWVAQTERPPLKHRGAFLIRSPPSWHACMPVTRRLGAPIQFFYLRDHTVVTIWNLFDHAKIRQKTPLVRR